MTTRHPHSTQPSVASPLILGRYEVFDAIASGGMATVHFGRIRGDAGFARTVAIKRMHKQLAMNEEIVRMFMDEARLVARIRHPNVLPILDVVEDGEEIFLVMEYLHGEPLDRLVHRPQSSPVPPAIATALFADVLHGLHAAHEATTTEGQPLGIVHRDVTPHNMLVGVDGSARIADFGIAKASSREQMMTEAGVLKGKLSYIAPEQLDGEATPATDIYAAAVSLYEALTGRVLFSGNNEGEILNKILIGPTQPPSAIVKSISADLDEIVMRGVEQRPHKRFKSARDMALALEKANARPAASEIAGWVETRAKDTLDKRSRALALIEKRPLSGETAEGQAQSAEAPVLVEPASELTVQMHTKSMDLGLRTVAGLPSPRRRRASSIALAIAVGLVFGVAGLGVIGWARAHRGSNPSDDAIATSAAVSSPATPSPEPTGVASANVTSEVTSPPSPTAARGGARPRPATTGSATAAPNCNPPYTRDETGRKLYKRECL